MEYVSFVVMADVIHCVYYHPLALLPVSKVGRKYIYPFSP